MVQFSIWEKETFLAPQDVIIVGSGFAGLWSAFHLIRKNPKHKILIVDRGVIPSGASARNAGFACFGSVSELMYDVKTMGTEKMLQLVEMRYRGLRLIQEYFDSDIIDLDLCGGYELFDATEKVSSERLNENITYLNALLKEITKTKRTFQLRNDKIEKFAFAGIKHLVKNKLEGYLHSGKLLQCLLQYVQKRGVQLLTGIEVTGFNVTNKVELATDKNFTLSANQLLICTNAFANELLPHAQITPARGQVLLTTPIKNLPWKGTFHYDEGFYYFRNLGNRVLLGGARNKAFEEEQTTDLQISDFIQNELEKFLDEVILPEQKKNYSIEHRWSGIMGMGADKLPSVKQVEPNVFCAIGMGGMGVAVAPVIGRDAARLILK
ncbi:MAG: FAD-binding oxidoreductase [Chitinophagaceae bacterium]|nr:FAD-binding oxidoreductase [Chitinophagaceae bacterium]